MTAYDEINALCHRLPKKINVEFAVYCARDCFEYVEEKDKAHIKHAIDLAEKSLHEYVSQEDLSDAIHNAYAANPANAANSAIHATYSAQPGIYAYYAANTAACAAHAAYAARHGACAATNASYTSRHGACAAAEAAEAAAHGTSDIRDEKMDKYLTWLKNRIKNMTELERIVYGLEG